MTDTPPNPVPDGVKNPVKGLGAKLKGLPPWAYIAGIGVFGAAVWYTYHKNQAAAATDATDTTGTDDTGALSATTAGDAFPDGSEGAGFVDTSGETSGGTSELNDFSTFLGVLFPNGLPTGGGQDPNTNPVNPVNNYTPPAITVNVPASATPTAGSGTSTDSNKNTGTGSSCPSAYPHYNSQNGPAGPKSCYKDTIHTNVCHGGKKCDEHGHSYQNGDWQATSWDNCGKKC